MSKITPSAIALLIVMIAVIVGSDIALFRNHTMPRFLFNIGTVLVFVAFYYRFLRK